MSSEGTSENPLKTNYMVDNEKESTFKYDNDLPSLPVPTLEHSIALLLDTIKPTVTDEKKFLETKRKANDFINNKETKKLQELLCKRAKEKKNWLHDWWYEYTYLRTREPLIPYTNMAASVPVVGCWPLRKNNTEVRTKRTSLYLFLQLTLWNLIREEKYKPTMNKGKPWSMNQFRQVFNSIRLPGKEVDEYKCFFNLAKEAPINNDNDAITSIIVLHKGYIFELKAVFMNKSNKAHILAAPLIEKQLAFIEEWCSKREPGPGIGCLTSLKRNDWAKAREQLSNLSSNNKNILDKISKCLFVCVLDEAEPGENEIYTYCTYGDINNRWADKTIASIAYKNGSFALSGEHTGFDGICNATMTSYNITAVQLLKGTWDEDKIKTIFEDKINITKDNYVEPKVLNFDLNVEIKKTIEKAQKQSIEVEKTLKNFQITFQYFGKLFLKEHRFHPEAFVQAALHATYYKLHKKIVSAYVSASTRQFYNGRTETCRSCFPEMAEFSKHFYLFGKLAIKSKESYDLLDKAIKKFQIVMTDATNGMGFDRHLMGLYLTAKLNGKKIPELYEDELVKQTNNYVLSTSCTGYWNFCGGCPPYVEDGYGCFYGISDNSITFCMSSFATSKETDLDAFARELKITLVDMQHILILKAQS